MVTNRMITLVLVGGVLLFAHACSSDDTSDDNAAGGSSGSVTAGSGAIGGAAVAGSGGNGGASAGNGSSGGGIGGGSGSGGGSGGEPSAVCGRPQGMAAVTLTYDDALPTQLTTAAPALRAHDLKATFFLTDVRSNRAPWAALLADGHELAAHTFKHPCPEANDWVAPGNASEDYDLARMATELDEGVTLLEELGQAPPYTFAYPCGIDWVADSHESYVPLLRERFAAARGVSPGQVRAGVDLWHVPATFSTGTGAALIAIAEAANSAGTWVVYGFHGIGGDSNAIDAAAHEQLLTYLDEHRSEYYVATFRELAACFQP